MNHRPTFSWTKDSCKHPLDECGAFREKHFHLVKEMQWQDGVLCCLPPAQIDGALRLFRLDAKFEGAERELATLCDRHHAIGIVDDRFIYYAWLRPLVPIPQDDLSEFLQRGWSQEDIDCVRGLNNPTESVHDRMKASLGRLISMPNFIADTNELRSAWLRLLDKTRPSLPIRAKDQRSTLLARLHLPIDQQAELTEFYSALDRFCDCWQIFGMATWRLPMPRGLVLAPGLATVFGQAQGELGFQVPFHFPLLAEDGVGRLVLDEHQRQAVQFGIDDHGSWQTYATMFDIYYWENVLGRRHSRNQVKAFVRELEFFLADLLGVGQERIRSLRKTLSAKTRGRISSLKGRR